VVTKPTGRPCGRPRKYPTAQPKTRSQGRPPKPIAGDPERYRLALAGAVFRDAVERGISESRAAESLCKFRSMVDTPDNWDRLFCGEKVDLYAPRRKGSVDKWSSGKIGQWRDGNEFRPYAHDSATKNRRLRVRADHNGYWLQAMILAYLHCLRGDLDRMENARRFAAFCGEARHFEEVMRPMLLRRSAARLAD
jgi:hypothetical protein